MPDPSQLSGRFLTKRFLGSELHGSQDRLILFRGDRPNVATPNALGSALDRAPPTPPVPPDPPPPTPPGPVNLAHSTADILGFLNASGVSGGDTIECAPGNYAFLYILNKVYSPAVTITAQDPDNPPVFAGIRVNGSAGFRLTEFECVTGAPPSGYGVFIQSSHGIEVDNYVIHNPDPQHYPWTDSGVFVRSCTSPINIHDGEVTHCEFGISHLNCNGLTIRGNHLHHLSTDGVRGGGSSNVVVDTNKVHDIIAQAGAHPDGIQFWTTGVTTLTSNITITNNLIYRGPDSTTPPQGIFLRDQISKGYSNVTITGNACVGGIFGGLSVGGTSTVQAVNVTVTQNFIQGWLGQRSWYSPYQINGLIQGYNTYSFYNPSGGLTNVTDLGNNTTIPENQPVGDFTYFNMWHASHPLCPTPG